MGYHGRRDNRLASREPELLVKGVSRGWLELARVIAIRSCEPYPGFERLDPSAQPDDGPVR